MTFSTGGAHGVTILEEDAYGVVPTIDATHPVKRFRTTSSNLNLVRDSFQSQELRGDYQISDMRLGVRQVNGPLGYELSYYSQRDFIRGALGGVYYPLGGVAGDALDSETGTDVSTTTTTDINSTAIDWTVEFAANDVVEVNGFTDINNDISNNGTYRVTAVTANDLTIDGELVVGGVGDTVVVTKVNDSVIDAGLNQYSWVVERQYNDISQYQDFVGCIVDQWGVSISSNGITVGEFNFVGKTLNGNQFEQAPLVDLDDTQEEGSVFPPMDSFTGTLLEGGVQSGVVTSIEMTLNRNSDPAFVVGNDSTVQVVYGRNDVQGVANVYFENQFLADKFLNETESTIEVSMFDGDPGVAGTNSITILLPRVKYTSSDLPVDGEGGIILQMNFQALLDVTTNTNIRVTFTTIP